MRMKFSDRSPAPQEPSSSALRRRVSRWNRFPDPELAAALRAPTTTDLYEGTVLLDASPLQTAVALSVLRAGDAIALLEFAPHHADGHSMAAGRERLRAFLSANGLERLDASRDALIDHAMAERIPIASLLGLGASHPIEDHDEGQWLEAARIWGVPNLTVVTTPDGKPFPFWEAALRGEIRAGDLLTVQSSSMGIRRDTSFSAYRALRALKDGTLPYSSETLRALVAVAADADEFSRGERVIAAYGEIAGGPVALKVIPYARGRARDEFDSLTTYAMRLAKRVGSDEWELVVALHDAGFSVEDLVWRLHAGETLRAVAASALEDVPAPLTDGWL